MMLHYKDIALIPLQESHELDYIRLSMIPDIQTRISRTITSSEDFQKLLAGIKLQRNTHIWMIEYHQQLVGAITAATLKKSSHIFQGGYWIDPAFRNMDIASSSLTIVVDFLFKQLKAERLQAIVDSDNTSSIRVLEKNGYQREGLLRKFYPDNTGQLRDVYMYALI